MDMYLINNVCFCYPYSSGIFDGLAGLLSFIPSVVTLVKDLSVICYGLSVLGTVVGLDIRLLSNSYSSSKVVSSSSQLTVLYQLCL